MLKHTIDFEVYEGLRRTDRLAILDLSEYFERPENMLIEVQFPSLVKSYTALGNPGELNVLTTKLLGFTTCVQDFPDGLYHIKVSVAPNEKVNLCKYYFKLDKLKSRIASLIPTECLSLEDKNLIDKLCELQAFVIAIKELENKDQSKALELFKEVEKRTSKIEKSNGLC